MNRRAFTYYMLRARRILAREGLCAVVRRAAVRAGRAAFRTTSSLWLAGPVNAAVAAKPQPAVVIRHLDADRSEAVAWMRGRHREFPWMYFPREIEAAERNGHIFTVIEQDGAIIGYVKVGVNDVYIHDFDRIVNIPPGAAFVYDIFILPGRRGRGIASAALAGVMAHVGAKGCRTVWCHIEPWNRASLGLFQKAGFRTKDSLRFVKLCALPMFIRGGWRPFRGWSAFLSSA